MNIDPANPVVALCAAGMAVEGDAAAAKALFEQAWASRTDDYEASIAAHFLARHQETTAQRVHWNALAAAHAEAVTDGRTDEFMPSLYLNLAETQALRGNLAEGRATFGRMVAAFPDNAEVEWWRGNLASMAGDYGNAVAHVERFRERSGHSLYSRTWAGSVLGSIAAIQGSRLRVRRASRRPSARC